MAHKYELIKLRNRYKIKSEIQTIAKLSTAIQGAHEIPTMFDDGMNKLHIIAQRVEREMQEWVSAHNRGFVTQNNIRVTINEDNTCAEFFSNVGDVAFCKIIKL